MPALVEKIAALPGWQRARVDRIRIDGTGRVAVTWMGMEPMVDPESLLSDETPAGVTVTGWAKPEPLALHLDPGADPEAELDALAGSGILGEMTIERITAPDEVRWRAQAWTGIGGRALVLGGQATIVMVLAADADRRVAAWRLKQAELEVQRRIRDALTEGRYGSKIAAGLGVTAGRVYQLRDGRR